MPAKSKSQQRFMGMVHACQKEGKCASEEVEKAAKSMKEKDAEDFASTKHKGLPEKVKPKKKKKKVNEAYEIPLEKYVQDLYATLEDQGMDQYEIDAILNDPDNMDVVEAGALDGLRVEETISRLDLDTPVMGYHQSEADHMTAENYVSESLDDFLNENYLADTEATYDLFDKVMDKLMQRGYTWKEADFAIDQASDKMDDWAKEGASLDNIADYIDERVFGIK